MFDPTLRSMPAVSSTKVMPTAMMPVKLACLTMLASESGPRKRGACNPKKRSTARKITSGSQRSSSSPREARVMRRAPARKAVRMMASWSNVRGGTRR